MFISCFQMKTPCFLPFLVLFLSLSLFTYQINAAAPDFRVVEEKTEDAEVKARQIWRSLAEEAITTTETNDGPPLILAANRTNRKDPSNDFKIYEGGWNISNPHYWSSVGYTMTPFIIFSGVWFMSFGVAMMVMCCCFCCCRKKPMPYSPAHYTASLTFLIIFTIAAVIGSGVLYTGQDRFNHMSANTLGYLVKQAETTGARLKNVSDYFLTAKKTSVNSVYLPQEVQTMIDSVDKKVSGFATTISTETTKNSALIKNGIRDLSTTLIVISVVLLILAAAGFLFSLYGLRCLVYTLIFFGWMIITVTLVFCGTFLVLENVVGDTCVSMEEYVKHPTAHTALGELLPCMDRAAAQETMTQSKTVSSDLINVVNGIVKDACNANIPPQAGPPAYFNQNGPLMPLICNPYNPDLTDRKCAKGEVELGNAKAEWQTFVCQVDEKGVCTNPGRLTPDMYTQMESSIDVSYALVTHLPFLVGLADCTFVRDAFQVITKDYCPGMEQYANWTFIGLTLVSVAVMLSMISWIIYSRERRQRLHAKKVNG